MTYIQYCSSHHWNSGFFYDNICLYNTHCNLLQRKGHPLEPEEKHNHQLWNIAFTVFLCSEGIQRLLLRITCFFTVLRIKVPITAFTLVISYMVDANCCFILVSSAAVKKAIPPQPQTQ